MKISADERRRRLRERWHESKHRWPSASRERQAKRWCHRNRWAVYRAWKKANPSAWKLQKKKQDANRNGRKRATCVGPVDFTAVLAAANDTCGICKKALGDDVTFDHIIPLALGGAHTQDNLQATHLVCNSRKGVRIIAA